MQCVASLFITIALLFAAPVFSGVLPHCTDSFIAFKSGVVASSSIIGNESEDAGEEPATEEEDDDEPDCD